MRKEIPYPRRQFIRKVLKSGVALYGGFVGIETLRDQRDFSKWTTVINGGNSPAAITIPTGAGATSPCATI